MVIALSLFLYIICCFYSIKLPDSYYKNKNDILNTNTFFTITAEKEKNAYQTFSGGGEDTEIVTLKLFDMIPVKKATVKNTDNKKLIPGGEIYGLKVNIDGVIVVGTGTVDTGSGEISPSQQSGVEVGDIIKKANGKKLKSSGELEDHIISSEGSEITLEIQKGEKTKNISLKPVFSESTQRYEAGLWVRDSTAGIGTVTFYNTDDNFFGSLGHAVCDSDTGTFLPFAQGKTTDVKVTGVVKSHEGNAGAIQASFENKSRLGDIQGNTEAGVFGGLPETFDTDKDAMLLGYKQDIEQGEAYIYCTLDEDGAKKYEIEIEKINYNSEEKTKNMVIKITDEKLIEKTGGIVQGMSGSPIIQNDRIIGAVTHVFVNDPERGYAIFCENMLDAQFELSN